MRPAAAPTPTPVNYQFPAQACPAPSGPTGTWPNGFPPGFPTPPGLSVQGVLHREAGLRIAEWTSPLDLRSAVIFALRHLPGAGFVIGRGDAELYEADIPFARSTVRGLFRIDALTNCSVHGYLAVVQVGPGSPLVLLPPHHTTSASPLPFTNTQG